MTALDIRTVTLAYLQRGGSPSMADRMLATLTANMAAKLLFEDRSGFAVGMTNGRVTKTPLRDAVGIRREANLALLPLIEMLSR